jgi:hypothetical protein
MTFKVWFLKFFLIFKIYYFFNGTWLKLCVVNLQIRQVYCICGACLMWGYFVKSEKNSISFFFFFFLKWYLRLQLRALPLEPHPCPFWLYSFSDRVSWFLPSILFIHLLFFNTGAWTQGLQLEPLNQPFFVMGFFKIQFWELFTRGWLPTVILLIS